VNHEKQLRVLAQGLSQIADVLPRIEFANALYPTARMQRAVSEIYSKIIRFFLRAKRWYQQGKLRHAWEALSRPTELYYDDLIRDVGECTKAIEVLANTGAQAEQRDMHLEIQELNKRLQSSEQILQELRGLLICKLLSQSLALVLTMRSIQVDPNKCESRHQSAPD
jgi:flagellin-specific chaperone FliS